jgi:isopenicillin-N N-acyltransferase-like protein
MKGPIPLLDVAGTSRECGQQLGQAWRTALAFAAKARSANSKPWWRLRQFERLISRYAPHLPDLYRGMAAGAGLDESAVGEESLVPLTPPPRAAGCTSFAIAPSATLHNGVIAGQSKDTSADRAWRYQVLRLALTDAPPALTLTYPGWLFGHGFVKGGCAIFRNSLFVKEMDGQLPFYAWGLLALHCPTVEQVVELSRRYGVQTAGHCAVADEQGGIAGIEFTRAGIGVLKPKAGLYVHANAVRAVKRALPGEHSETFTRSNSLHREKRLLELLKPNTGRLTAPLAFQALSDHDGYPVSLCRHQSANAQTTAVVVVEPARGLLHACRGQPCCHWPKTYSLAK